METSSAAIAHPATDGAVERPRRLRMWPAALALLFLSPIVGEMISGSTPPLLFVQPFALIFLPAMYGAWALLTHEVSRGVASAGATRCCSARRSASSRRRWSCRHGSTSISPQSPSHIGGTLWPRRGNEPQLGAQPHDLPRRRQHHRPASPDRRLLPTPRALPWLGPKRIVLVTVWMLLLVARWPSTPRSTSSSRTAIPARR